MVTYLCIAYSMLILQNLIEANATAALCVHTIILARFLSMLVVLFYVESGKSSLCHLCKVSLKCYRLIASIAWKNIHYLVSYKIIPQQWISPPALIQSSPGSQVPLKEEGKNKTKLPNNWKPVYCLSSKLLRARTGSNDKRAGLSFYLFISSDLGVFVCVEELGKPEKFRLSSVAGVITWGRGVREQTTLMSFGDNDLLKCFRSITCLLDLCLVGLKYS